MKRFLLAGLLGFALLGGGLAAAQTYYGPPPSGGAPELAPVQSRAFFLGGAIGAGAIFESCDNCQDSSGGIAAEVHVGTMLNGPLGLVLDAFMVGIPAQNNTTIYQTMISAGIQYYMGQRFFLRAGLALGYLDQENDNGDVLAVSETGYGLSAGAGYEIVQAPNWNVDLQLRLGVLNYSDIKLGNIGAMIGMNWY